MGRAPARRAAKVSVCDWEDERIEIRYQGKARPNREIAAPEPQVPAAVNVLVKPRRPSGWKPAAGHPWREKTNWLQMKTKGTLLSS